MTNSPLVSAIIIFLNEERFLTEAIDSVLAQTYDNWELLLIDDGSRDRSSDIAQHYARRYPERIRYVTHLERANRGMSASRALGVELARGDYIAYLDGDDVWLPHKLENQLAFLFEHPNAQMTVGPLRLWYSWSDELSGADTLYGAYPNGRHPYHDRTVPAPELLKLFLKEEQFIPSGFLARRSIFAKPGIYQEAFVGPYSDAIALVQVCLTAAVYVSGEIGYRYRQHRASDTYRSWLGGQEQKERLLYLTWVEQYLNTQPIQAVDLKKQVQRELWKCRHPLLSRWLTYQYWLGQVEVWTARLGRQVLPVRLRQQLWDHWQQWRYPSPDT
jgi:glycosyltransferase involved in cell wall biosynthesis